MDQDSIAFVIVAHDKPIHLQRLVDAIQPFPVFLHIDASTDTRLHEAMVRALPDTVTLLPRLHAGWAHPGVLDAELCGYRWALEHTSAEHIVLATGSDYPLASPAKLAGVLDAHRGLSFGAFEPLPKRDWGVKRGYDRFIFAQRPWRGHRVVVPVPRHFPRGVTLAGGTQTKILARHHVQALLNALDANPKLLRFLRNSWIPDEVCVPTVLSTESFGVHWDEESVSCPHVWHIDWGPGHPSSPRTLGPQDFHALVDAAKRQPVPALFARKFADDSEELVRLIDADLRY